MSANALESQGIVIAIGDGATPTEVFTSIPEVKTFSFGTGSAAVIDVTDLSSAAKEKRMGLQDWGQLTMTINYIPKNAQHALLLTAKGDRQARNFRVTFTDGPSPTVYAFSAYVLSLPVTGSVDGVIESNVTLEITGDVTEVA